METTPLGATSPYAVIDIETGFPPEAAIVEALAAFKPHPSTKDAGKIEAQRLAYETKVRDKSALLDAAPITCAGVALQGSRLMFNGMAKKAAAAISGFTVIECGGEKELLVLFLQQMDGMTGPDTVLAGHYILGFDLPKLRARYVYHRIDPPRILIPALFGRAENQPVCDLMRVFTRYYTAERADELFISLEEVARLVGLNVNVKLIAGKDIPQLAADGKVDEVLLHCAIDVMAEEQCFQLFSGLRSAPLAAA